MATISGILGKQSKWIILIITILMLISICLGNISSTQAQSFKRIYKNGVVYYYFSSREEGGPRQLYVRSGGNKIIRLPEGTKVSPLELEPLVQEASLHHNLPPSLIKAIIKVESNFNPAATSLKGAQGLMQLMPGTAAQLQVSNPYDIRENICGGALYLKELLGRFNNQLPQALAAYNAGPHKVVKHQGIPPIVETQNFVRDVCKNFLKYSEEQPVQH